MGRIVDLCGEIAAAAEEGPEGPDPLPRHVGPAARGVDGRGHRGRAGARPRQPAAGELVESADSLSARLVEVLGCFGDARAFKKLERGRGGCIGIDAVGQLARRVSRLEEILEAYREGASPDRARLRRPAAPAGRVRDRGRARTSDPVPAPSATTRTTRTTDPAAAARRARRAPLHAVAHRAARPRPAQPHLAARHGHLARHRRRLRHPRRARHLHAVRARRPGHDRAGGDGHPRRGQRPAAAPQPRPLRARPAPPSWPRCARRPTRWSCRRSSTS